MLDWRVLLCMYYWTWYNKTVYYGRRLISLFFSSLISSEERNEIRIFGWIDCCIMQWKNQRHAEHKFNISKKCDPQKPKGYDLLRDCDCILEFIEDYYYYWYSHYFSFINVTTTRHACREGECHIGALILRPTSKTLHILCTYL